jgi:tetratricopeptide (TPR) repeat protein/predicted small secreted protein
MKMRRTRLIPRALLFAAVLLANQQCGGADVNDGAVMRPAMVILLPDAAKAAEGFSKFLRKATESDDWTASIRQVYHLTLPDGAVAAVMAKDGGRNCTTSGKSVVFLLEVSAGGELEALRERARLQGDEEVQMRRRKKRKKKVVDLHNPCVLWLDQQADLEAASGVGMDVLSAATRSLPAPYRNTVRQEEEAEEAADSAHAATTGPTGKVLPASWRLKKAQKKAPPKEKPAPPNLGSYLVLEAGATAYARGNYTEAVLFLEKAAELRPDSPSPLNKLGQALLSRGAGEGADKGEAVRVFRKVVAAFPRDTSARTSLGAILEEEDTEESRVEALSLYTAALAASPRSAEQVVENTCSGEMAMPLTRMCSLSRMCSLTRICSLQMAAVAHMQRRNGDAAAAYRGYNESLKLLAAGGVRRAEGGEIMLQARIFHGIGLVLADSEARLDDGIAYVTRATGLSPFDSEILFDLSRFLLRRFSETLAREPRTDSTDSSATPTISSSTPSSSPREALEQVADTLRRAVNAFHAGSKKRVCAVSGASQRRLLAFRGLVQELASVAARYADGAEGGAGHGGHADVGTSIMLAILACPASVRDEL